MRQGGFYWNSTSAQLWRDEKVLHGLDVHGKLVWCYLLTGPHMTNFPLAFCATVGSMASTGNIPLTVFRRGMNQVIQQGMAKEDARRQVVLLPNALRHIPSLMLGGGLSSKTLKGWASRLSALPNCALKQEAVSLTLEAVENEEGRRKVQGRSEQPSPKEAMWFAQAVETIKNLLEAPSKPLRSTPISTLITTTAGATAPAGAAAAPQPATAVVVVKGKAAKPFSQTTTTTPFSALEERERTFLELWNHERADRGRSCEVIPHESRGSLQDLLDEAERKNPDNTTQVLSFLVCAFLDDDDFRSPKTIRSLLNPKVWEHRLDEARAALVTFYRREQNRRRL